MPKHGSYLVTDSVVFPHKQIIKGSQNDILVYPCIPRNKHPIRFVKQLVLIQEDLALFEGSKLVR